MSETLGLRWRDVDLKAGTLSVNGQLGDHGTLVPVKTPASAATVTVVPGIVRALRDHHARQRGRGFQFVRPEAFVFTTSRGKPQSRRNALRALHAAGDAAGLNGVGVEKVGLHDLRHSLVGIAFEVGLTLPETATLARHANARTTAVVYAGITGKAREQIASKLIDAGVGG